MQISARTIGIVLAVIAAGLTLALWPKKALSPEDEIRALVARCVRAAEERDLSMITDAMAPEFSGPNGASRDEVKQILLFQVMRGSEKTVFNPSLDVTVEGPNLGAISGKFVFAAGKVKTPDGGVLSAWQIDARLQKRDGKWLFVWATYRQL